MGPPDLASRCERLRALHRPGDPLVLPNAWDAASARAVAAAGFAAVATSSGAVAASLGFEDHEGAPADEMLAAAARIAAAVDVPVTVDAESGYGLSQGELVERLQAAGAAGANLEDTDHAAGRLRAVDEQAAWLAAVREAATARGYPLVLNARVDVFLTERDRPEGELLDLALVRAHSYLAAGADCVYPIFLHQPEVRDRFLADAGGPVNLLAWPAGVAVAELAAAGAARISWGVLLHRGLMEAFAGELERLSPSGGGRPAP